MNKFIKIFCLASLLVVVVAGCHKVADLPYYDKGTAVTLTANKSTVAATPADSLAKVINFSWTNPHYSQEIGRAHV